MLDHIFLFVHPSGQEIMYLENLGLVETYRRAHPGQGTQNICYCFDNMFLELLWVDDAKAICSAPIRRTGLYERSLWRTKDSCPFGIAWRTSSAARKLSVPTWAFSPPYLPEGMSIAVAIDGDDPRQPMMFQSPGSTSPIDWPLEKRRQLQHDQGLGAVREISLTMPRTSAPSEALKTIAAECQPNIQLKQGMAYELHLCVEGVDGRPDLLISLPSR